MLDTVKIIAPVTLAFALLMYPLGMVLVKEKTVKLRWPLLTAAVFLLTVYCVSPENRIISAHGMMYGAMAQQISNGEIPPTNPFLADMPLYYPWGHALLAAGVCWVLPVTIASGYVAVNVASLLLVMVGIHAIVRQLVQSERAGILACYVAVFGTTMLDGHIVAWLSTLLDMTLEHRGVPASMVFGNINGAPVGLVLFCLLIYSLLQIFTGNSRRRYLNYGWLAMALLGGGFLYPQMLFGVTVSVMAACLVNLIWDKRRSHQKVIFTMSVSVLCAILLWPYLTSISPGVRTAMGISSFWPFVTKAISWGLLASPLLAILCINARQLRQGPGCKGLVMIGGMAAATLLTYLVLTLTMNHEYKAMVLSVFSLGIAGGVAIAEMQRSWGKIGIVLLVALLMFPSYSFAVSWLLKLNDLPPAPMEQGRDYHVRDREEDKLYEWIRNQTAKDSVFVDTELAIPVMGKRRLWMGPKKKIWQQTPGFGVDFLADICRYDKEILDERRQAMADIYQGKHSGIEAVRAAVGLGREIYIVARSKVIAEQMMRGGYDKVFVSAAGNYSVYTPEAQ